MTWILILTLWTSDVANGAGLMVAGPFASEDVCLRAAAMWKAEMDVMGFDANRRSAICVDTHK